MQKLIQPVSDSGHKRTVQDLLDDFSTPVRKAGKPAFDRFLGEHSVFFLLSILHEWEGRIGECQDDVAHNDDDLMGMVLGWWF